MRYRLNFRRRKRPTTAERLRRATTGSLPRQDDDPRATSPRPRDAPPRTTPADAEDRSRVATTRARPVKPSNTGSGTPTTATPRNRGTEPAALRSRSPEPSTSTPALRGARASARPSSSRRDGSGVAPREVSALLEALPDLAPRIRIGGVLPSSEHGWVLDVVERKTQRPMVLKLRTLKGTQGWADWDRFEHEAKVLRSLRCRGIPRYFDHGDTGPLAYLLMARAPGRSLAERLARGERWSDAKLRHIVLRMLDTLTYLHGLNPPVFHGDIHPEHVVVSGAGDVHLVSFGRARSLLSGETITALDRPGYTRASRPDAPTSAASDLYALGATVAAVASGADASQLPRLGDRLDLESCMKPSAVRDALVTLMAPSSGSVADVRRRLAGGR